jgi:hypothetical protein
MTTERWYVKRSGDARIYGLTERREDAELLATRLARNTGDEFYAMRKPEEKR